MTTAIILSIDIYGYKNVLFLTKVRTPLMKKPPNNS